MSDDTQKQLAAGDDLYLVAEDFVKAWNAIYRNKGGERDRFRIMPPLDYSMISRLEEAVKKYLKVRGE